MTASSQVTLSITAGMICGVLFLAVPPNTVLHSRFPHQIRFMTMPSPRHSPQPSKKKILHDTCLKLLHPIFCAPFCHRMDRLRCQASILLFYGHACCHHLEGECIQIDSARIDLDRRRHECCRACTVLVNVLREALIAHIHLAEAGEDLFRAGVVMGRDICLPLLHKRLCLCTIRGKETIPAILTQDHGALTVQHVLLCVAVTG